MFSDRGRGGRPSKAEGPRVPYEEVDRILVFGEVVPCEGGNGTTAYFPTYREIAERYGVSNSVIADYAKSRNVQRRRKEAQARIQVKADQKLTEMRASAIAVSKDDELRIIDSYLVGFETALADGRVRFDNAADFNTMVRLKEFVQGNADSRQEIHAALSLETLQNRHRKMMQTIDATVEERGEIEPLVSGKMGPPRTSLKPPTRVFEEPLAEPPTRVFEEPLAEPSDRFAGRFDESEQAAVVIGSSRELGSQSDGDARRTIVPKDGEKAKVWASPTGPGRCCSAMVTVAADSAQSAAASNSSGFLGTTQSAEPTAPAGEEHHESSSADYAADDALADTLPPPPMIESEGSCE